MTTDTRGWHPCEHDDEPRDQERDLFGGYHRHYPIGSVWHDWMGRWPRLAGQGERVR
jgi:hypothetical protein